LGLFFDMDFDGDEIAGYELDYFLVGIYLGFQPSTSASGRGGAKV